MTRKQFKDRFTKEKDQLQEELYNWTRHIELGNHSQVMLTQIDFGFEELGSRNDKWLVGYRVSGYVIEGVLLRKNQIQYLPKAAFSSLLGGLITDYFFNDLDVPSNICQVKHGLDNVGYLRLLDWIISKGKYNGTGVHTPMNDDDTRTLVLGNALPMDCGIGVRDLFNEPVNEHSEQMVLDMVRTINEHPESRSRMLNLFDKLGAPDNVLGAAIKHMDKFRSF